MTLLPIDNRRVVGIGNEEHKYPLNEVCAVPGCFERADDPHHIWRRSALGNAAWWVALNPMGSMVVPTPSDHEVELIIQQGHAIPHVVGLCRPHHDLVTVDKAWIRLEHGRFEWYDINLDYDVEATDAWNHVGTLDPQPGKTEKEEVAPGTPCPRCKRKVPAPFKGEAKRKRVTKSIRVPKDEQENGVEILDGLIEQAAVKLGREGEPDYYVLVEALYGFVTTRDLMEQVLAADEELSEGDGVSRTRPARGNAEIHGSAPTMDQPMAPPSESSHVEGLA